MTNLQLYNKINSILKQFFKLSVVTSTSINFYNEDNIEPFVTVWIHYRLKDEEKTKPKNFNFGVDDNNLYDKLNQLNDFYDKLHKQSTNIK